MSVSYQVSENHSNDLFEEFIRLHHTAFGGTFYNAAYHALAGAFHYADQTRNLHALAQVEQLATLQLEWLDANLPAYEHSTRSAHLRGHVSIFTMLARQAHARCLILRREHDRMAQNQSRL